jgi:hypothetical protein
VLFIFRGAHENDGYKRVYLIEFKATISKQSEINKDFLKLKYETKRTNYPNFFIHVLDSYNKETIKGLKDRYKKAFALSDDKYEHQNKIIVYICMRKIPKKYSHREQIITFNSQNYENELDKYLK